MFSSFFFQLDRVPVQPCGHRRPALPAVRAQGKRKLLRTLAARAHDDGRKKKFKFEIAKKKKCFTGIRSRNF